MNSAPDQPPLPLDAEPSAQHGNAAVWPFILLALGLFGGGLYVDAHSGGFNTQVYEPYASIDEVVALHPKSAGDEVFAAGRTVYKRNCEVCHGATGAGVVGNCPPLAGSDWVLVDSPNRLIRLVLNGGGGPITVKGELHNPSGQMLAWKDSLTDADIAAVLTFVRGNKAWGNNALPVATDFVKSIREIIKDRADIWTADELLKIPLGSE
jgi:mono/diheme cytochrome c family protein